MRSLDKSEAAHVMVFMTSAVDHVTGLAGLTLTITVSKNGGAFGAIAPVVNDRGAGWYDIALTAAITDTEGDLALHVTGALADPTDVLYDVSVTRQLLRNKRILNGSTGVETIYQADGVTALFTRQVWEDAAGTQTYRDLGADRVERYA